MQILIKKYKQVILLVFIILIAAFLRFYQLGVNPPSLTWDEAAWGYNAYSLGIDGKDEFGRFLPYDYLESFGDFKPPIYAYLTVLPAKILGLNEFATRFPSALFGVLTVLLTYFLVKRIFWKSEKKEQYALFSSLILAISPWHIMLSRAAFEANVASFFVVLGIWGFLAGVQNKKWYLVISSIAFALSMYTFNTPRVVAPILVLLLVIIFRKRLLEIKKQTIIAFIVGLLVFLPTFGFLLSPQAGLRFKEVNIFTDIEVVKTANREVANDNNAWWSKIMHNRRFLYSVEYVRHFLDNLNPNFLFIKGDGNPKFSTQEVGQLYIWDIIFLVGGLLFLFKKKEGNWWIIPLWLLIGIIPAATARETPHALRIETTLPTFQIFVAYGLVNIINSFKKWKYSLSFIIFVLLFINVLYFAHDYFVHYPISYSSEWQKGYKESIAYVSDNKDKYDKIFISQSLGRPYIYYLFYMKIDPKTFREQSIVRRDAFGFVTVEKVGKLYFTANYPRERQGKSNNLYISDMTNIPENAKILKTFYLLNGQPVLVAYII